MYISRFLKYFDKHQSKQFEKTYKIFRFDVEQIDTFSDMDKLILTVTDNELTFGNKEKYVYTDIKNIELIDTILKTSNKGTVIKITFYNQLIICFSLGYPFLLSKGAVALNLTTLELYHLLLDKWKQNTSID